MMRNKQSSWQQKIQLANLFILSLSGCLYGYNVGSMSGVLLFIQHDIALTHAQTSFFVASFLWGIVFSMLIISYLIDHAGRKKVFLLALVGEIIGVLVLSHAHHYSSLLAGRLLMGIACGLITLSVPLYLAETLPSHVRGRGTVAFQLFLTLGILAATFISWLCAHSMAWRTIFLIELIPVGGLLLALIFAPESPRWLVSKNHNNDALRALSKLYTPHEAQQLLTEIIKNQEAQHYSSKWHALFKNSFRMPLLLAISLGVLNQLTGINVFLQYDATILTLSGFAGHNAPLIGSLLITGMNFFATCCALILVDQYDRRHLLQYGLIGIIICLLGMVLVHTFSLPPLLQGILTNAFLLGFILFFALAPGALVWTLRAEILPEKIRSIGLSISLLASSTAGALFSTVFLPLQQKIGLSSIFLFALLSTLFYLKLSFHLPQTTGYSLESIEQTMKAKT